mmetsp:Transcript_35012/g.107587  ORF Transcript_35012/g.107587 Transcript_35012/m.107587 type:complete len:218 (-) Transcript_35012:859-1512(-)
MEAAVRRPPCPAGGAAVAQQHRRRHPLASRAPDATAGGPPLASVGAVRAQRHGGQARSRLGAPGPDLGSGPATGPDLSCSAGGRRAGPSHGLRVCRQRGGGRAAQGGQDSRCPCRAPPAPEGPGGRRLAAAGVACLALRGTGRSVRGRQSGSTPAAMRLGAGAGRGQKEAWEPCLRALRRARCRKPRGGPARLRAGPRPWPRGGAPLLGPGPRLARA